MLSRLAQTVSLVFDQYGWSPDGVFAQGGTGYTNPGQVADNETDYPDRVPEVVAYAPDVVLVQGSTNDGDPEDTARAATATLNALRAALPNAAIIVIGPTQNPVASTTLAVDQALGQAAQQAGVAFTDAWQWLDPADPSLWSEDNVHPSNAGHQALADRVTEVLVAGGVVPA